MSEAGCQLSKAISGTEPVGGHGLVCFWEDLWLRSRRLAVMCRIVSEEKTG